MRRGMSNPSELKVRCYAASLVGNDEYLAAFPGAKSNYNISETELNKIILNIIPNGWSEQVYVQGFDCETITFRKAGNILERM